MDSLATATLAELAGAVSARALSPVEIVQGCLDRIAQLDRAMQEPVAAATAAPDAANLANPVADQMSRLAQAFGGKPM